MRGLDAAGKSFSLSASRAIITLPLGVLHGGSVAFDPLPREHLTLARSLAMGSAVRVTLLFRSAFWRSQELSIESEAVRQALQSMSFLFAREQLPPTWWTSMPDPDPIITAWVGGPRALSHGDAWPERCLQTLSTVFRLPVSHLQQLLVSSHWHDWQSDPLAGGAYSYVLSGGLAASRRLADPIDNTLFFAGEHTDQSSNWGTVHGALGSGLRAAQQVLRVS